MYRSVSRLAAPSRSRSSVRKTSPRVVGGRVMRKNRHACTRGIVDASRGHPIVVRERPGRGYRHLLTQKHVHDFLAILPDWPTLARGLHGIVLAPGDRGYAGSHDRGVIEICAWDQEIVCEWERWFFDEHAAVLARLDVDHEPLEDGAVRVLFTEDTARAYQLLHVLLHELGHHHDRMTTRSRRASRGEKYAEDFALDREALVWARYARDLA